MFQSWFPETKKGLIASIVVSGYGFGSCLWTPIQTQYVNPSNLKAQIDVNNTDCEQIGKSKFFLDEGNDYNTVLVKYLLFITEILDNVPSMFLMLGIVYAVMGGLSAFLISENKPDEVEEEGKQIVNEDSNSIKPLKVFKLKWFYQVSYIKDQTFAFIIHINLDMDWILQHFHMHGDCRNNIKSFWSDIYQ